MVHPMECFVVDLIIKIKTMSFQPTPLKYKNDDKPALWPLIMYGMQWFLITIPIVIILSSVVGNVGMMSITERTLYTQKLFAVTGIGFIVQVLWGHKLPLVIGPATVLLIGLITSQASQMNEVYTAIICGGVLMFLLSYTGWMKYLQKLFTSRIIIVILALIAFTIMPTILQLMFADKSNPLFPLVFSMILVVLLLLAGHFLRGIWKSTVVMWGLLIGSICYRLFMGDTSVAVHTVNNNPTSIFLSGLVFNPGILLSFLFCYVALFINEIGSIQSVGAAINVGELDKRSEKGLRFTGLLNILSGSVGVLGPVDFSLSPGVIMSTGCASRYTLVPAGIALILCAFFPGVIHIFTAIPQPVMGVIMLYLMMTQLASALQMMSQKEAIPNFESCMVIAVPIMISLVIVFMPANVVEAMPAMLRPLLGNGFVVGVIAVLFMEHVLYRKK